MARVKFSGLVQSISGSIGGTVFSSSQSGFTARSKATSSPKLNPRFFLQQTYFRQVQDAWSSLTPNAQKKWNYFASYSNGTTRRDSSIRLTGYTLFVKWQMMLLNNGGPMNLSPVFFPITFPEGSLRLTYHASTPSLFFELVGSSFPDDCSWYLFMSSGAPRRLPSLRYNTRFMKPASYDLGSDSEFYSSYIANFGAVPQDDFYVYYDALVISWVSPVWSFRYRNFIQIEYL